MKAKNKFKRQLLKYLRTCQGIHNATTLWQCTEVWAYQKHYFKSGEYGYYDDHISVQISNGTEREEFKVYLKDLVKPSKKKVIRQRRARPSRKIVSRLKKVKGGWKKGKKKVYKAKCVISKSV